MKTAGPSILLFVAITLLSLTLEHEARRHELAKPINLESAQ